MLYIPKHIFGGKIHFLSTQLWQLQNKTASKVKKWRKMIQIVIKTSFLSKKSTLQSTMVILVKENPKNPVLHHIPVMQLTSVKL